MKHTCSHVHVVRYVKLFGSKAMTERRSAQADSVTMPTTQNINRSNIILFVVSFYTLAIYTYAGLLYGVCSIIFAQVP